MAPKPAAHALHTLARTGDAEGVAAALAADPDCVTAVDSLQRTALHLAAWAGHAGVVRLLLEAKANVHAGACDNMLAIHFRCRLRVSNILTLIQCFFEGRQSISPPHFSGGLFHHHIVDILHTQK